MGIVCIRSSNPVIGVRHLGLMPTTTASGIPMSTTNATETPVTSSRSIESDQKPSSPKETKVPAISSAIRQLATASPTQVANAVTPNQPIWGTGRGKSGMETIRCNQSKALRKPSAMLVVSWMIGLVSRLARTESRKPVRLSCRSVCSRPGSSRVFVPRVMDHSTIHTTRTPSTRAQRGTCRPGFSGGGGPWAPDCEGVGAIVAVTCPAPLDRPSPLRRRPAGSRRRRRCRRASRRQRPAWGGPRPVLPVPPPG